MDGFEVFDRVHSRVIKTPLVTLQARGYISLNLAAYEALKSPKAVELMFNKAERVIGMKKIDPSAVHAVFVRKQANSPSYMVSGTSFSNLYDIDTSVARRYRAEMQNGILIVDLKQPGAIATGPRTNLARKESSATTESVLFEPDEDVIAGVHPTDNVPAHSAASKQTSQEGLKLKETLLDALARLDESSDPHEIEAVRAQLGKILGNPL